MANSAFDFNGGEAQSPSAKAVADKLSFLQANISKCAVCDKRVYDNEKFVLDQRIYHKVCFRCSTCRSTLTVKTFRLGGGLLYCHRHYLESFHKFNSYNFNDSPARRTSIESHGSSPLTSTTSSSTEKTPAHDYTAQRQLSRESYDRQTSSSTSSAQTAKAGERPPLVALPTSPTGIGPNASSAAGVSNLRSMFETGVKSTAPGSTVGQEKRNDAAVLSMMVSQSTTKSRMAKFGGNSIEEATADIDHDHRRVTVDSVQHAPSSSHSSSHVVSDDRHESDDSNKFERNNQHEQQQQQYEDDEEQQQRDEQEEEEEEVETRDHHQEDDDNGRVEIHNDDEEDHEHYYQQQEQDHRDHHQQQQYEDDYDEEEREDGYQPEENGQYYDEDNGQE